MKLVPRGEERQGEEERREGEEERRGGEEEWRQAESSKGKHLEGLPDGTFIYSTSALHTAQYMHKFFNTLKPELITEKTYRNT